MDVRAVRLGQGLDSKGARMIKKRSARMAMLACASVAALGLLAGVSPASAKKKFKTRTVSGAFSQCQNLALPVTDHSTHLVQFTVPSPARANPAAGTVGSVSSVGLRLTHTNSDDMAVYLVSPGGRVVPLFLGRDGTDLGSGATNCGGTLTTFSDAASTPIGSGTDPYAGTFRPEHPLSTFNGGAASGIWTLVVSDTLGGDIGTLDAASLNLSYSHKVRKKVKAKKK
jgi:subtilisin-like proprotein convertase family protein